MSDTDKPELRRANDNPWYCLATMHGEQPIDEWDDDLADKNRLAWNRWIATALPDPERLKLPKSGFPESDLTPLAPEEKLDFCRAFAVRTRGETRTPPELAAFCDLSSTDFDRLVDFRGFLFAAHMDFSWSNFRVGLDCSAATFQHSTDFGMATIKSAGFESATFYKHCSFIETKIGGGYFESAKFKDAYFHRTTFSDIAEFRSATFGGLATFDGTTFRSLARFRSASFKETARFRGTTFGWADFTSATFSDRADFGVVEDDDFGIIEEDKRRSVAISEEIIFVNTKFGGPTSFERASFGKTVPDFRGATMHDGTEWHGASWPKPPEDRVAAQAQVYAYERLKQEMERLKKHEDEQSFFRKELRSRRGLASPWSSAWLLNCSYEILSDYGQSLGRPLLWLFGAFAAGLSFFSMAPVFNGGRMTVLHAAMVSFANVFSFLPITRDASAGLTGAAKVISAIQSIFAAVLLFLLGLALRNRFRMK